MPFIQNVSAEAVMKGTHFDCGENSMLIQITDPCNASFSHQTDSQTQHTNSNRYISFSSLTVIRSTILSTVSSLLQMIKP